MLCPNIVIIYEPLVRRSDIDYEESTKQNNSRVSELVLSFLFGVAVTYYASEIFVFLRDLRKALEALVFSLCPLGALVFRHAVFGLVYCLVVVGKLLLYIPPLSRAVHNIMKVKSPCLSVSVCLSVCLSVSLPVTLCLSVSSPDTPLFLVLR